MRPFSPTASACAKAAKAAKPAAGRPKHVTESQLVAAFDIKNLQRMALNDWNDVPTPAHRIMAEQREQLKLARPGSGSCRAEHHIPFTPPSKQAVQVKLTDHLGLPFPGSNKAVLYVRVSDVFHDKPQLHHKLKLLAGPRYNPDTDSITISSDNFASKEENAKWCSDALDRLIQTASDPSDPMTDLPLDPRPALARASRRKARRQRVTPKDFPQEWYHKAEQPHERSQRARQKALDELKALDG